MHQRLAESQWKQNQMQPRTSSTTFPSLAHRQMTAASSLSVIYQIPLVGCFKKEYTCIIYSNISFLTFSILATAATSTSETSSHSTVTCSASGTSPAQPVTTYNLSELNSLIPLLYSSCVYEVCDKTTISLLQKEH